MRFSFALRTDEGFIALLDSKTNETRLWIRGFTYKKWICAQTGKEIPISNNAFRLIFPKNSIEGQLRIDASCFDQ